MATTLPDASRNAMCNALVDLLDAGAGAGSFIIGTSALALPATGVLATLALSAPAAGGAGASNPGEAIGNPITADTNASAGTAELAKLTDSDGNEVLGGDVGLTSSGAAVELSAVAFQAGWTVEITGWTVTVPASA